MKNFIVFLLTALTLLACEKDNEDMLSARDNAEVHFFNDQVSRNDAKNAAQVFIKDLKPSNKLYSKKARTRDNSEIPDDEEIKDISEITDDGGSVLMRVINFIEGGFCIVSATKKVEPILAYSETGYFDNNNIPNIGITMWIDETSSGIINSDSLPESQIASNRLKWMSFEESDKNNYSTTSNENQQRVQAFNKRMGELSGGSNSVVPLSAAASYLPPNRLQHFKSIAAQHGSPEQFTLVEIIDKTFSRSVGPLINSNWHQGSPFNGLAPNGYSGCTAVAAGQIMYFFGHPTTYNWDHMSPSNLYLYDDIKYLMRDLGASLNMDYESDGSGANIDDVKSGLQNDYGYQVTKSDHNINAVTNWLFNNHKPVYMTGKKTSSWFGLIYKDGMLGFVKGRRNISQTRHSELNGKSDQVVAIVTIPTALPIMRLLK